MRLSIVQIRGLFRKMRPLFLTAIAFFGLFGSENVTFAQDLANQNLAPVASSISLRQSRQSSHLEIDLSAPVAARVYLVENPERLIIDLPQVNFLAQMPVFRTHAALITSFRYGLFAAGQSRIVMDLHGPAKVLNSRIEPASAVSPAHLIVDVEKTDATSFHAAVEAAAKTAAQPELRPSLNTPAPPVKTGEDDKRPLIVIDPGHGGPDSGAIGVNGTVEKVVVFNFATALKAKLESSGKFRVLLTRTQDVFVPLEGRSQMARAANASLFLSLHADTLSASGAVSGATIYTVSDKASDAEAARVAAHENQADAAGGLVTTEQAPQVADILFDLTRRETRSYAHVFSKSLIAAWKAGPFLSLNKNPQRSAGFVVLKAPDVPSVLLELGYLSSSRDVQDLVSPIWCDHATDSVLSAIDSFFAPRAAGKKVETAPAETLTQTDMNLYANVDFTPLSSVKSPAIDIEP